MARLGALGKLDLHHLDLRRTDRLGEEFGIKATIVCAAAEVARSYLPDEITPTLCVIATQATFARIVGKTHPFLRLDSEQE